MMVHVTLGDEGAVGVRVEQSVEDCDYMEVADEVFAMLNDPDQDLASRSMSVGDFILFQDGVVLVCTRDGWVQMR